MLSEGYNSTMDLLFIVVVLLLIAIASARPNESRYSEFEIKRRVESGAPEDLLNWRRFEFRRDANILRRLVVVALLTLSTVLSIASFGWVMGTLVALMVGLLYGRVAAVSVISGLGQKLYNRLEPRALVIVEQMSPTLRMLGGVVDPPVEQHISSREELVHLIETSDHGVLTKNEQKDLMASLTFRDKYVRDYMTPRSVMEAIGMNELLGPLMLDRLHQTGHTHFPVMDGDIDHLVGILHIYSLFTLENKKSLKVKDAMEPRVFYIHQDQLLEDALSACIKHRRHLLVVVNEYRETVGVITIEDAVEQLIGRKIVDQFQEHDDLRAVAARNPKGLNTGKNHVDV